MAPPLVSAVKRFARDSWTPSTGTALYAGYNDDINYNGYNPFIRTQEPGFRSNGRTFFIKASYLFRKSF